MDPKGEVRVRVNYRRVLIESVSLQFGSKKG